MLLLRVTSLAIILIGLASCGGDSKDSSREGLIYVQVITTPGDYAPVSLYPTNENKEDDWIYGLGQPTKLGKQQEFELGILLRRMYDDFITTDPHEVDVFSAAEDRATLGALTLMAALYEPDEEWRFAPGLRWQPITISHQLKGDKFFYEKDFCKKMHSQISHYLSEEPMRAITKRDKQLYSFWERMSGITIRNVFNAARMFDILEKEKSAGLNVPSWAISTWQDLKRVSDEAYSWKYNTTVGHMLKVGSLWDLVLTRMKVKKPEIDNSPNIRFSVYMTHDWNMAALLQSMGYFDGHRPGPCTTVVLEQYNEGGKHKVRALLFNSTRPEEGNQRPHVLRPGPCEEYCPLNTFADHFKHVIPKNFKKLCESGESSEYYAQ